MLEWLRYLNATTLGGWSLGRMGGDEMTKGIYKIGLNAEGVRGIPSIKWEDKNIEICEGKEG